MCAKHAQSPVLKKVNGESSHRLNCVESKISQEVISLPSQAASVLQALIPAN